MSTIVQLWGNSFDEASRNDHGLWNIVNSVDSLLKKQGRSILIMSDSLKDEETV